MVEIRRKLNNLIRFSMLKGLDLSVEQIRENEIVIEIEYLRIHLTDSEELYYMDLEYNQHYNTSLEGIRLNLISMYL